MATTTDAATHGSSRTYTSLAAAAIPLAALCLAFFVEMVDNTLLSIALPTIGRDLGSSTTALQWITGAYSLTFGGLLLTKYVPLRLPSVAWISLVAILFTLPMLPWSGTILPLVSGIDFLALAVPPLAYAGFAISRMELDV